MLYSDMVNWHCLLDTGEREQICSVSRMAIDRNISTANSNSMDNWLDLHVDTIYRLDNFNINMDFSVDLVANTDVQGISGRDVQVTDCRGLC